MANTTWLKTSGGESIAPKIRQVITINDLALTKTLKLSKLKFMSTIKITGIWEQIAKDIIKFSTRVIYSFIFPSNLILKTSWLIVLSNSKKKDHIIGNTKKYIIAKFIKIIINMKYIIYDKFSFSYL